MQKIKRGVYLDLFRYILTFFVVCIHFLKSKFALPLFRVAVPSFFIIAGFFCYKDNAEEQKGVNIKRIKSSLKYLIIGFLIYFIVDLTVALVEGSITSFLNKIVTYSFYDFFILNYNFTTGRHLWFLIALFLVYLIHFLMCKFSLQKFYKVIFIFLLLTQMLLDGYLSVIFDIQINLFLYRNALFFGLPMFILGYEMRHMQNNTEVYNKKIYLYLIFAIIFLILSLAENLIVFREVYFSSIISAVLFFKFFYCLDKKQCSNFKYQKFSDFYYKYIGKNAPFYVYIFHILVGNYLFWFVSSKILKSILIFISSFIIYVILFNLINLISKKIKKNNSKVCDIK